MMAATADLRSTTLTLLIGTAGASLAWSVNMPLGFLAGPALAVAIASLMGLRLDIAAPVRDVGFLLVGLTVGSMVTPASLGAVARWPIAFLLLATLTLITPYIGRTLMPRLLPFDRDEAFLATAPGHLSLVVALADSLRLSVTRPAILASIRVLTLTLAVPFAAELAGLELGPGLPGGRSVSPWGIIGIEILVTLALTPVLIRCHLPAPILLAGMIVGATGHLSELATGNLPQWVSQGVLIGMGSLIGTRFRGTTPAELLHNLLAGAFVVLLTTGLALLFALPAAWLSGLPLLDILVGFAPGGLETMVIVGVAMGADPSFVATAHVVRLLLLAMILTAYATRLAQTSHAETNGQTRPPGAD